MFCVQVTHTYIHICTCTVAANKKLTFRFVLQSFQCVNVSVFTLFATHMRVCQSFLRLRERLIGRRDRTAVIDRSHCRVKETSFREVVSHGEAQRALAQTS